MLEISPTLLLILATVLMLGTLVLAFIPILPGPLMPWAVAIVFGALTGWQRVTPLAAVIMTLLMLVGVTADIGVHCWVRKPQAWAAELRSAVSRGDSSGRF